MKKLLDWMESSFTPMMNKINHNVWVITLKDSINQTMPLIFLGSIFSLLSIPGSAFGWEWWPQFGQLTNWTMGLISLMMAFLIPFNFMEKSRLRKSRIIAGISGVILFCICITPRLQADEAIGFAHSAFGAGGMFAAIVCGIITGLILRAFGKFSFFSEESSLPDFIRAWFDQMLPLGTIVLLGWIVVLNLGFDLYNTVLMIFMPLQNFVETWWGFALFNLIGTIFYAMGISAWILTPITTPLRLAGIEANMTAGAANVFTSSFNYSYLTIGGVGCTLGLSLMLFLSRSKRLKALGKAVVVPAIVQHQRAHGLWRDRLEPDPHAPHVHQHGACEPDLVLLHQDRAVCPRAQDFVPAVVLPASHQYLACHRGFHPGRASVRADLCGDDARVVPVLQGVREAGSCRGGRRGRRQGRPRFRRGISGRYVLFSGQAWRDALSALLK